MHPKYLKISDFTYDLPNEKIAYAPVNPRDSSKLLIYKDGKIQQNTYRNLVSYLNKDCILVFNDTKVIKARILFQRETGAMIEVFCLEPHEELVDYANHFQKTKSVRWKCLVGNASKWKEKQLHKEIEINGKKAVISAEIIEQLADAYIIELSWTPEEIAFGEIIDAVGTTPLPPYIKREANKTDEETYQTVYSSHKGSVAAPTAGLHFTQEMLKGFKEASIKTLFTTLHVGAGTFKPVKSETMEGHIMHNEWMNITTELLENLLLNVDKTIISVGTTSMRTLESIFWMGNKVCNDPDISHEKLQISQWEPYENPNVHTSKEALEALLNYLKERNQNHLIIETGIIIAPGYSFKIVKGLITNFHQPQSTLLLLVSALIGEKWHEIYQYALDNNFRFLSYGDGSLLLP